MLLGEGREWQTSRAVIAPGPEPLATNDDPVLRCAAGRACKQQAKYKRRRESGSPGLRQPTEIFAENDPAELMQCKMGAK